MLRFLLSVPFSTKSWPGYTIAYAVESVACFASLSSVVPLMSLFCGSCWILTSMGKDITNDLKELNVSKLERAKQSDIEHRFCSIIKRFSEAKQLSLDNFALIYQHFGLNIDSLLAWSMNSTRSTSIWFSTCFYGQSYRFAAIFWCFKTI